MDAYNFYATMSNLDQEGFHMIVQYYCDSLYGTVFPTTIYRLEDSKNKIYAIKPRDTRFFNFAAMNKKLIITNAYKKHSQKMAKADLPALEIAIRHRNDYLLRT